MVHAALAAVMTAIDSTGIRALEDVAEELRRSVSQPNNHDRRQLIEVFGDVRESGRAAPR